MQENLFPESHQLHDAGREPRLWVHRLRLLERPGGPVLRTLTLRRGMNVFWSPGGHGTGKSLLCGMIRYVLGDSSYADQETRGRLLAALPEAVVQAEVLSAGERWAIQRALNGRRDAAIAGADLSALQGVGGFEAWLRRLDDLIPEEIATELGEEHPWQYALAWLTREQGCRLAHLLDWRVPTAESGQSQNRLVGHRVVSALLGAKTEDASMRPRQLREQLNTLRREIKQAQDSLGVRAATGVLFTRGDAVQERIEAVQQELAALSPRLSGSRGGEVERLSAKEQETLSDVRAHEDGALQARTRAALLESLTDAAAQHSQSLRGAQAALPSALQPGLDDACSVAEATAAAHRAAHADAVNTANAHAASLQTLRSALSETQAWLHQARDQSIQAARREERRLHRIEDQLEVLQKKMADEERLQNDLAEAEEAHRLGLSLRRQRIAEAGALQRAGQHFGFIARQLLGAQGEGRLRFRADRIEAALQHPRHGASGALQPLSVLAFDLAALCQSIEGQAHLPALLLHDSPREADLSEALYARVFHAVRAIEEQCPALPFQYVLTTTSAPPPVFQQEPWLRHTFTSDDPLFGRRF